jgi:hypothetical protein
MGHAMISFSQKTFRQAGATVALVVGLCATSTLSFAFSPEAQQICTGDAFRLCSAIPNVSAVTTCMLKQRVSLSAGCRSRRLTAIFALNVLMQKGRIVIDAALLI